MRHLLAVSALLAALSVHAQVRSFGLRIDDVAGLAEPWPVIAGLPFPEGALNDAAHIRIADAGGRSVPAQIDVTATWRDGSIRWALASFSAEPSAAYRVEFGEGVEREVPNGIQVTDAEDGGQWIDTGAARFLLTDNALLFDRCVLTGDGAMPTPLTRVPPVPYLNDSRVRWGDCAYERAGIETTVLKHGPLRYVARKEGWYVTQDEEKLARGIARMSFFAGSAMVKVEHTLVFTEDTNTLWVRDYGFDLLLAPLVSRAAFDTSLRPDTTHQSFDVAEGESIGMLQDDYPHFAETNSHFSVLRHRGDGSTELAAGEACGEWVDAQSEGVGLTVVLPDLVEQFPKELEVGADGIRVHLWPARSGKELDFRAETLVRDYWQSWADLAPGGAEALARVPSNAQGAAKTHEMWLIPRIGEFDAAATARRAHALCEPVLAMADPEWTCATQAIGWPLHPKDTDRFPAEEAMISDFWNRLVLPYQVFPMTGVIAYGCHPYLQYTKRDGKWYAEFYRLSQLVDYGMRRHAWSLYARSGERKYFEYAKRFDRFAADWEMAHATAGQKIKGGFALGDIHKPFYWGTKSLVLNTDISGHDVKNWMLNYYMTGDERAIEAVREFAAAARAAWDLETARKGYCPFVMARILTALYTLDWDEDFGRMAHDLMHLVIDMDSPNGLTNDMPYGAMYKVDRNASALYDYYMATGDEPAKVAFLKAIDYQYRFNRIPTPIEYQNGAAYLLTIAHDWTGRESYLRAAHQLVRSGLVTESKPLNEEIAELGNDLRAGDRLPHRGPHLNMHPTLGMPTALGLIAKQDKPIPPFPLLVKAFEAERAAAIIEKPAGESVSIGMYFATLREGTVKPRVLRLHDNGEQTGVDCELTMEQRMESYAPEQYRRFHCSITLPANLSAGLYTIDLDGPESFIIQDADTERVALWCPDGFWTGGGGPACGARMYFSVPDGLDALRLFVGRPQTVFRPDGSVALQPTDENIGEVSIPVNGQSGAWSVQSPVPAHTKLRNVPPVAASGSADRLLPLRGVANRAQEPVTAPSFVAAYVDGVIGQGMQTMGDRALYFSRGARREAGGYEHFPAERGTIEFWFRPNFASNGLAFGDRQLLYKWFVRGGAIDMYYRYGAGPVRDNLYSYVDLLTRGTGGADHIGAHARQFFAAGTWTHFAATWELKQGQRGVEGDFMIYVNGERAEPTWDYPRSLSGRTGYVLNEVAERIRIGPSDGTLDELRISDIVRYDGHFTPAQTPFASDEHTLALFHFDGEAVGVCGVEGATIETER